MSILIKGVEMPKYGCDHCFLRTGNYCGKIEKDESVVEYARRNERHPDCPLVSIPPHGDLIDRDDLSKRLNKLCDRVCQYSEAQRSVMCGACPLGDAFAVVEDDAPVITEAEED